MYILFYFDDHFPRILVGGKWSSLLKCCDYSMGDLDHVSMVTAMISRYQLAVVLTLSIRRGLYRNKQISPTCHIHPPHHPKKRKLFPA